MSLLGENANHSVANCKYFMVKYLFANSSVLPIWLIIWIYKSWQPCLFLLQLFTFSSPLISTLICNRMAPETLDLSDLFSKLYHTSISPDKVRTSMMVCPKKSSDSRVNFCLILDLKSLSSSHTRTLIRSDELWHSLKNYVKINREKSRKKWGTYK